MATQESIKAVIWMNEIRESNFEIAHDKSNEMIFKSIFKAKNEKLRQQREFGDGADEQINE